MNDYDYSLGNQGFSNSNPFQNSQQQQFPAAQPQNNYWGSSQMQSNPDMVQQQIPQPMNDNDYSQGLSDYPSLSNNGDASGQDYPNTPQDAANSNSDGNPVPFSDQAVPRRPGGLRRRRRKFPFRLRNSNRRTGGSSGLQDQPFQDNDNTDYGNNDSVDQPSDSADSGAMAVNGDSSATSETMTEDESQQFPGDVSNDDSFTTFPPDFWKDLFSGLEGGSTEPPVPATTMEDQINSDNMDEETSVTDDPQVPPNVPDDYPGTTYPPGFFKDMLSDLDTAPSDENSQISKDAENDSDLDSTPQQDETQQSEDQPTSDTVEEPDDPKGPRRRKFHRRRKFPFGRFNDPEMTNRRPSRKWNGEDGNSNDNQDGNNVDYSNDESTDSNDQSETSTAENEEDSQTDVPEDNSATDDPQFPSNMPDIFPGEKFPTGFVQDMISGLDKVTSDDGSVISGTRAPRRHPNGPRRRRFRRRRKFKNGENPANNSNKTDSNAFAQSGDVAASNNNFEPSETTYDENSSQDEMNHKPRRRFRFRRRNLRRNPFTWTQEPQESDASNTKTNTNPEEDSGIEPTSDESGFNNFNKPRRHFRFPYRNFNKNPQQSQESDLSNPEADTNSEKKKTIFSQNPLETNSFDTSDDYNGYSLPFDDWGKQSEQTTLDFTNLEQEYPESTTMYTDTTTEDDNVSYQDSNQPENSSQNNKLRVPTQNWWDAIKHKFNNPFERQQPNSSDDITPQDVSTPETKQRHPFDLSNWLKNLKTFISSN
ncbi:hypothetical protein CEXT_724781 [Caerostris extrusa]|uniref:Uncharacterized protein n=1 Tax=Caerostris extrusa TaxID=172846 RepID=A0AAV4S358_CAEEX|nr:hypothetical protein CEXT_724781 [Caerostris extrusa]